MNSVEQIKAILREKSGKKLAAFSAFVFLLITALVFYAVLRLGVDIRLKQMNEGLGEIPKIIDNYSQELSRRSHIYEEDILTRAEIGLKLYCTENGLTDAEKLERVRDTTSAASISLLDGQGQVLTTTGPVSPEEIFRACSQALEARSPHLEFYSVLTEKGEETEKSDGKGFVRLPIPGNAKHSLMFEFSCDAVLKLYNSLNDWPGILAQILSGDETTCVAKTGDKLASFISNNLSSEQASQLNEELTAIFRNADDFRNSKNERRGKIITLLGKRYLATMTHYPQTETDILLTIPLIDAVANGIYIAAAISAIIGWGMVLLQIYIFRRLFRRKAENDTEEVLSCRQVCQATWPGILVVLAVTILFSTMLLLLESRSNASFTATVRRISVESDITWRKDQEDSIRSTFTSFYRTCTQALAAYLTEHPEAQTKEGLKELSHIAQTEYLMRFDSTGQEIASSNSYTGFSVGTNLSEEYRAVLMGYPYIAVGPAADPYTGKMQLGTAILMTDGEGQPDGFLLAVYSAEDLTAELKRMKAENAVNNFAVKKGHIAALINDEDGCFTAHTDRNMIGLLAGDFLEKVVPGSNYEGLIDYKEESMYASMSAADGKTLLFMVPEREDSYTQAVSVPLVLVILLVLALLYYPIAGLLIARAMTETKETPEPSGRAGNPMLIFSDGYSIFLTLFVIFALIASSTGWWTSFEYVFSGMWSKGLNLFSLWAALFTVSVTLFCTFLIRTVLRRIENRISLRAKTITRLAGSLVTYAACIFLLFDILDMFGVNTTVLLASAGVVSIAVGMGAQSMASDLLAGFFMMLEGSVHVGDYVRVSKIKGRVTDMGIRTTEITDDDGNTIILNNSKVNPVYNITRSYTQQEQENDPKKDSENDSDDDDDDDDE